MPKSQRDFIRGWKRLMPDWEVIRWDESNFPIELCSYTIEAYSHKQWAFVSDVARLWVLKNYGGVYLDTDFKLFSSLEPFLGCPAFTGFEIYKGDYENQAQPLLDDNGVPLVPGTIIPCCGLLAGIIGAEPNNKLIEDCLDRYLRMDLKKDNDHFVIINNLISTLAVEYGFRYLDIKQELPCLTVFPSCIFACESYRYDRVFTVAIHRCMGHSWMPRNKRERMAYWLDCHGMLKPVNLFLRCFGASLSN